MTRTLRTKLTLFNTTVTGVILLAVTVLCLFLSEKATRQQTFQSFESFRGTLASYLSRQDSLSADWLRQMETTGNVSLLIYDNGTPLFSQRRSRAPEFRQLRQRAQEEYFLLADRLFDGKSCAFSLEGQGGRYLGSVTILAREDSVLEVLMLHPLAAMEQGLARQRLWVCLGTLLALALLWAFSWQFTGFLLRPIQESQQRQSQFTAAASHELRTPLTAILSAASAMERAGTSERCFFLGQIQSEGQRMSRLLEDLLLLSSGDSQNWEIRKAPTDVEMLLLEAYEGHLGLAKKAGLTLSLHIPDTDLPPILLDRERIYQVLSILLDNALSYTPAPGRIALALEAGKRTVRILVSDTGPGVPEEEKERIFGRFHRGEKARSDRSHFGLGLSIAAQIAALHGGKLWVRDAALGGAEFVLELS